MKRQPFTKMQILEARHPGLIEKVHAMFAEFWPTQAVKQMIQTHYGERLGLRSLERYKGEHWRVQRELVQEMSEVIGPSGHRVIDSLKGRPSSVVRCQLPRTTDYGRDPMSRSVNDPMTQ